MPTHDFHLHPASTDETTVLAPEHHIHRHPKGRGDARAHPDDANRFFAAIARTLEGVDALLILGPSTAKHEFSRHLHEHAPQVEARVVGVEAADHLTDGQIVARARQYFVASDRMG